MDDLDRTESINRYPGQWARMMEALNDPGKVDQARLMYTANYLFSTAGIRWAMDPMTLHRRLPMTAEVNITPLALLDYLVLTHSHADHLDPGLLDRLREYPARWIVPEFLLDDIRALGVPAGKLISACPGVPIQTGGLTLTPFEGQHFEADDSIPGGLRGLLAMGYMAEFSGKRWLLPGDTRRYDASRLPDFGMLDGLVAHLWLGRGQALSPHPPLLKAFCNFCLALKPRRIVITHLYEWGRPPEELWTVSHGQMVVEWFKQNAPGIPIEIVCTGNAFFL